MRSPTRFLAGVLAAGVFAATFATAAALPAEADEELGLSHDGRTWDESLQVPLFDPDELWVPGDEQTASFMVRNHGPEPAALTVQVQAEDRDRLLTDEHLDLALRAEGGQWQQVPGEQAAIVQMPGDLDIGDVGQVDLRAVFDPDSSNASQRSEVPIEVVVTLSGAGAEPDEGSADPGDGEELPIMGVAAGWWLLWAAGALVLVGLMLRRRRAGEVTHG